MECFEDVLAKYYKSSMKELFPSIQNPTRRLLFYLNSIIHTIGVYYIFFGMLITPYRYIGVYITFLVTIVLLYFMLNDKCFMNDFFENNKDDAKAGNNNDSELCEVNKMTKLRMKTIYKMLCFYLGIAVISLLIPTVYPQNLALNIMNCWKDKQSEIIHYLPVIMLYFWILLYLFVKLTKLK